MPRAIVVVLLCHLSTRFCFSPSSYKVYLCVDDSDKQSIFNHRQQIESMVINMLQNWSHRYSNHNSNIKYLGSIIKYIGFKLIHYAINLDVVSSFMVFSEFDSIFLSIYC